jgi:rRNA-processing protein FCF1
MEIATDPSGTHALQSLIEIINLNKNEKLLKEVLVEENVLKLSFNNNGTHILQKIISCFEEENRLIINKCVLENLSKLCMNANGICVVIYKIKKIYIKFIFFYFF